MAPKSMHGEDSLPTTQEPTQPEAPRSLKERRAAANKRHQARFQETVVEEIIDLDDPLDILEEDEQLEQDPDPTTEQLFEETQRLPSQSLQSIMEFAAETGAEVDLQMYDTETAQKMLYIDGLPEPEMPLTTSPHEDTALDLRLERSFIEQMRRTHQAGQAGTTKNRFLDDPAPETLEQPAQEEGMLKIPSLAATLKDDSRESTEKARHQAQQPLVPLDDEDPNTEEIILLTEENEALDEEEPTEAPQVTHPKDTRLHVDDQEKASLLNTIQHNRSVLRAFHEQAKVGYLWFAQEGMLFDPDTHTSQQADDNVAYPKFDGGHLSSLSVPIRLETQSDGMPCESHLVLSKVRGALTDGPLWSRAIAELQATSHKTVMFRKWLSATQEDLDALSDKQLTQLHLLLDVSQVERLVHEGMRPQRPSLSRQVTKPDRSQEEGELLELSDNDIIHTNHKEPIPIPEPKAQSTRALPETLKQPKQETKKPTTFPRRRKTKLPSKIMHPSRLPSQESTESEGTTGPSISLMEPMTPQYQPQPHTLARHPGGITNPHQEIPSEPVVPKGMDENDTGVRRIRLETAPLDPTLLRLHVHVPRKLAGKWFQGTQETLSIFGRQRELRLPQLGLNIQFTYSQTPLGKVFPQVVITRSTNIRDITFAQHPMEVFANLTGDTPETWRQQELLDRGHRIQVDLSATDQERGIMELRVQHPRSGQRQGTIHINWSVKD